MNTPELRALAQCVSEESCENLYKVYWTHSAGLRNCFWTTEITILMRIVSHVMSSHVFSEKYLKNVFQNVSYCSYDLRFKGYKSIYSGPGCSKRR